MAPYDTWPEEPPLGPAEPLYASVPPAAPFETEPALPTEAGPPLPPGEGPDDQFGMGLLIGALLIAALAAVGFAVYRFAYRHNPPPAAATVTTTGTKPSALSAPIPNLLGERAAAAAAALRASGFSVRLVTLRGTWPAGAVIDETPTPGSRLASGSTVTIAVSDGAASPSAPAATTSPSTSTPGRASTSPVTTQAPPAQTTPSRVAVPDLVGDDLEAAADTLTSDGLLVSVAYVPGTNPLDTVDAQSPSSGATAPSGSHVTINASAGPGVKPQELVPDVAGKTIPAAVSAMQHAGLRLIYVKQPVADQSMAGTVVGESPAAGSRAPHLAQVLVSMAVYRPGAPAS